MAKIKAFKGYRPPNNLAQQIAAVPYDVINVAEAKALSKKNDLSFLKITRSEVDFEDGIDVYSDLVYEKARANFLDFVKKDYLVKDEKDSIYLYQQKMGQHQQIGIVACSHIDDYFNDVIKKHEYTRPKKENDRINNMYITGIHAGPIFTTFKQVDAIDSWIAKNKTQSNLEISFSAEDQIEHSIWKIDDALQVNELVKLFQEKVAATYIADGHHRAASSAKVGKKLAEENKMHTGNEDYNYMLTVLFPENQLSIIDYNRLVKDLNGLSENDFLSALKNNFQIFKRDYAFKPFNPYSYGMFLNGQWYELQVKDTVVDQNDPIKSLDIAVLSDLVLDKILAIKDQRTDSRIDFVGGIRGLQELERRVNNGENKWGFSIYPVSIRQLINVADSGKVMPPKSTWFEPKLRSGLVLHRFA